MTKHSDDQTPTSPRDETPPPPDRELVIVHNFLTPEEDAYLLRMMKETALVSQIFREMQRYFPQGESRPRLLEEIKKAAPPGGPREAHRRATFACGG